jgi:colicin import membrane protein
MGQDQSAPKKKSSRKGAEKKVVNPTNNSEDKIVGKDDKGRTIYEGPRGGRYYLTENGNKVYVTNKKDN